MSRDRVITWVPFSQRRVMQWDDSGATVFNAELCYVGAEEIGSVYHIGDDLEFAYGQLWGHRIGACKTIEEAKLCVEKHAREILSGKPSCIWGFNEARENK